MKKIISLLLILAAALCLTACRSSFHDGKTSISVVAAQYGSNTAYWWLCFEQDFEAAYPDVDMVVDVVSWNDIRTVVDSRIAGGDAPDIVNIDVFADYQAQGLLLPIGEYVSQDVQDKMLPTFLNQSQIDGEVWALPAVASARALYYNVDLLKQAETQVPKTWEELRQAAQALKDHFGGEILPWGVDMTNNEGQACFAYYIWSNGGDFLDEDGQWWLNRPKNVEALNFVVGLVNDGLTNPDPAIDTRYDLQEMFSYGKLAMMIGPNQISPYVSDGTEPVSFGIAPIPAGRSGAPVYGGVMDRFLCFDNARSQQEQAAVTAFFDFFFEDHRYADWIMMENFLPVTTSGAQLVIKDNPAVALWMNIVGSCKFCPVFKPEWAEVKQGVIHAQQQALYGGDVQQLLDELQAQIVGSTN